MIPHCALQYGGLTNALNKFVRCPVGHKYILAKSSNRPRVFLSIF